MNIPTGTSMGVAGAGAGAGVASQAGGMEDPNVKAVRSASFLSSLLSIWKSERHN
jgi:hypothetical protein